MKTIYTKLLFFMLLLPFGALAQAVVSGTVVDDTGLPLPGVNIVVSGTSNGVSTDFDGKYQIQGVNNGDVLVFSYVGYAEQSVPYQGQPSINITLKEDANQLSEVVVQVGYGSVRKKDATGAVTTITERDFNRGPVVSADQMIQGKVAGLQIINGGGAPGEGATVRIRSGSSLSATNDPLYVIDGLPVLNGGVQGGRNPLATLNQNDIESVTVLKDASATAIYGSRASNGVILITTKKGRAGELKVNYNGNFSVSQVYNYVNVLSTRQFRDYINTNGFVNDGINTSNLLLGDASTDWQKEIYRTATGTDHNVSLSGGADNITYRASVGYADLNGILLRDNMNRITLGGSVIGNFFDNHLRVELNNNTSSIRNDYSNRGAIGAAINFDPTQSPRNEDGSYFQWSNSLAPRNPLSLIHQFNNYGRSYRSLGNIQFDYKLHFLPDLRAIANFGYEEQTGRSFGNTSEDYAFVEAGNIYSNTENRRNQLMDLYLNYKKDLSGLNTVLDLTGGYSYQGFRSESRNTFTAGATGVETDNSFGPFRYNIQSFFGRANVTIKDRYLFTLSFRTDATSRFTEEYRWSNFPAAAFAWKMDEEAFLRDSKTISSMKLRFGWGITGQQDVLKIYPSIPLYAGADQGAQYQFGDSYVVPFRPEAYNPNLKWEETETQNIGLDFGFFEERFTGSVDLYRRITKDLLLFIPNPAFFGFSNADFYNVGGLENRGVEIAAEVIPLRNDNVTWRIGGNITFQDSEITNLATSDASGPGFNFGGYQGGVGNTIQNLQVGYEPYAFHVYEQAYGADGQPLDGVYIDRNQDGLINEEDRYRYKKPAADVFYGFNTYVNWKNLDFSMAWRGSWGNYNYNNVQSNFGHKTQLLLNETAGFVNNGVDNVLETGFSNARYESDYYIQDASFVRLDNVTIGYTFNKSKNSNATYRITASGQNLLLFTEYEGIDPEISGGIDSSIYPRPVMYTLGLNVNF